MSACAGISSAVLALGVALLGAAPVAGAEHMPPPAPPPARVVSINLCTDQLAMMLARPGQLVSVSALAVDPRASAMVEQARRYRLNHGGAEQIFLMRPDLVLAGSFTTRATVSMLERLGIRVVRFRPAYSLDDVRARILKMGTVLGRRQQARALAADFARRLQALRASSGKRPRAALYFANGYTLGDKTLAGQILTAAAFDNIAAALGFAGGGTLPLEVLVMARPRIIVTGVRYPGASRAESILDHPVLRPWRQDGRNATIADADWVCGTPYVLRAIAGLVRLHGRIDKAEQSGENQ